MKIYTWNLGSPFFYPNKGTLSWKQGNGVCCMEGLSKMKNTPMRKSKLPKLFSLWPDGIILLQMGLSYSKDMGSSPLSYIQYHFGEVIDMQALAIIFRREILFALTVYFWIPFKMGHSLKRIAPFFLIRWETKDFQEINSLRGESISL